MFTSLNQVNLVSERHFIQDDTKISFETTRQVLREVFRHKGVFPLLVLNALCQPSWYSIMVNQTQALMHWLL